MPLIQQETVRTTPALDKAYYLKLCNLILMPFNRQDAYMLGIIDRDGNKLRDPKDANEETVYNELHELAYGLKKIILKQPGGMSLLRSTSIALNSLNKIKNRRLEPKDVARITESFEGNCKFANDHSLRCIVEEILIEEFIRKLDEDGESPTNNTSGVAGVTLPMGQMVKRKKTDGFASSSA